MKVFFAIVVTAGLFVIAAATFWGWAQPPAPGAFYDPPRVHALAPGALLRAQPIAEPGARAWRILYATSDALDRPIAASALIVAPEVAGSKVAGPLPLVVWAHGTGGIARGCAPSLGDDAPRSIPNLAAALARGWVMVAPDYPGLGTGGPNPYLIGQGEGRAVLDATRAARRLPGLAISGHTVIWGHSQGGHAALWAGILSPRYAPDVNLAGVAAIAPVTDLAAIWRAAGASDFGRIIASYVAVSYAGAYPDVRFAAVAAPGARWAARDVAGRCLDGPGWLATRLEAETLLGGAAFAADPAAGPLGERLRQNAPTAPIAAPVLILQGGADGLVTPAMQARFVAARCAARQPLEYRVYPGLGHGTLLAPRAPATADLLAWTAARLAAQPAPNSCP